jgi:hypothetical protein
MILVDDASTDPRVPALLEAWVAARVGGRSGDAERNVGLRRGGQSRPRAGGGTGRAGRPAELRRACAAGLGRTPACAAADPAVASVTPFSEHGGDLQRPLAGQSVAMTGDLADRIDGVARTLVPAADLPSAPTGVGFCMALSRAGWPACRASTPRSGAATGRRSTGARRSAPGRAACGGAGAVRPVMRAARVSGRRRPACLATGQRDDVAPVSRYDADVQRFLRMIRSGPRGWRSPSPGRGSRRGGLPVYLAHSLGGGADMALEREIARDLRQRRCGGRPAGRRHIALRVELHLPTGRLDGATASFDVIRLAGRGAAACGSSIPAAWAIPAHHELPGLLLQLAPRRASRPAVRRACTTSSRSRPPIACWARRALSRSGPRQSPDPRTSAGPHGPGHRLGSGSDTLACGYLAACDEITAFSQAARDLRRGLPTCRTACGLARPACAAAGTRGAGSPRRPFLGILGNLNAQKARA